MGGAFVRLPQGPRASTASAPTERSEVDIDGAEQMLIEEQPAMVRKARVVVFEMHDLICDTARLSGASWRDGFVERPGLRARGGVSLYLGTQGVANSE